MERGLLAVKYSYTEAFIAQRYAVGSTSTMRGVDVRAVGRFTVLLILEKPRDGSVEIFSRLLLAQDR